MYLQSCHAKSHACLHVCNVARLLSLPIRHGMDLAVTPLPLGEGIITCTVCGIYFKSANITQCICHRWRSGEHADGSSEGD